MFALVPGNNILQKMVITQGRALLCDLSVNNNYIEVRLRLCYVGINQAQIIYTMYSYHFSLPVRKKCVCTLHTYIVYFTRTIYVVSKQINVFKFFQHTYSDFLF